MAADPLDPSKQLIPDAGMKASETMANTATAPVTPAPVVGGVSENETVSGQIKKLIAEDSPLMEQARGSSQQQATARGLQNSSIAAQAGEQAVISSALPIAQQDASTNATRQSQNLSTVNQFGSTKQQGDINSQLQKESTDQKAQLLAQEGTQTLAQINAQTDASARLQLMDQNFKSLMADKEAGVQLTLADKNFQNQQSLLVSEYGLRAGQSVTDQQNELARMDQQNKYTIEQIDAQAKAAGKEYGPKLQAQYLASVSDRMSATSTEIANIYSTQGLTASQQTNAVQVAYQRMQTDLATLAATYAQSPLWDDSWGAATPVGAPNGSYDSGNPNQQLIPDDGSTQNLSDAYLAKYGAYL